MGRALDSGLPTINARTSHNHPCEIAGDLQFVRRVRGSLTDLKVVFVGEVTNLCRSWFEAARILPIHVVQVGPEPYLLPQTQIDALNDGAVGHVAVSPLLDEHALKNAGVLYTDCRPKGADDHTRGLFTPYRVTRAVVDAIASDGLFLPCPPVTRGEEVSADSLDSPTCRVYEAKEYLLHTQNAIMEALS
ncbi:MAG: hypothetical protein ACOC2D_19605 [Spirochaetota bacterium]